MITLHASAVAIDGYAVILRGPSGAGKSDLALRLIDEGAILVADDYVELHARKNHIEVTAPEKIRGLFEIYGLGIVTMPVQAVAELALVCDLSVGGEMERLPEKIGRLHLDDGPPAPIVKLDGRMPSASARLRQILRLAVDNAFPSDFDKSV
ncbi:MAG: HPr kinase/phosphatase C-terminal domain-containing protein [Sneathiella sp.]